MTNVTYRVVYELGAVHGHFDTLAAAARAAEGCGRVARDGGDLQQINIVAVEDDGTERALSNDEINAWADLCETAQP